MKNTKGLAGTRINGHSAFEVAIARFRKLDSQVLYDRICVGGVYIFDIKANFHYAIGFT